MKFLQRHYSQQDLVQLFVFCAFPIHIWSIIFELQEVPSMLLYMNGADIVGSLAYNMTFTLVETALIYLPILIIGMVLKNQRIKDFYVTLCSILLCELVLIRILFELIQNRVFPALFLIGLCCLVILLTIIIVPNYPQLKTTTRMIASHLTVLTFIYIFIDWVGVIIVITRVV